MTLLDNILSVKCNWQVAAHNMLVPTYKIQHSDLCCCCWCIAFATLHCFRCDVVFHISPAEVKSNHDMLAEAITPARLMFWNKPAWHRVVS